MKQMKKLFAIILAMLIVAAAFPTAAFATTVQSGECGDNLSYSFDDDGTLTISGTGDMKNYTEFKRAPWNSFGSSIKKVVIGSGVTSIGDYAFNYPNLTTVIFEENSQLKSIGWIAFNSCASLKSINLPDSLTTISTAAFGRSGLESITIPDNVTSIPNYAFTECSALKSVTIGSGVESIGPYAFSGTALESLAIPEGVTSIGEDAFYDCDDLNTVTIGAKSIGSSAFDDCSSLKKVTLGSGVESIGGRAFYCCENLETVNIPDSVNSIGGEAFWQCTSLESISIGNGVTTIGNNAFNSCQSAKSLTIGSNVESIGEYAFYYCTSLESIKVSADNTTYDSRNNCNAIIETETDTLIVGSADTVIPDTVKAIGFGAFVGCENLKSITIPGSVESIVGYAFTGCTGLKTVTISEGVTSIEEGAFCETALKSVNIPASVTSIGDYVFATCSDLTSITVSEGNTVYDSRNNCNAIIETETNTLIAGCKDTVIPETVTSIGGGAFCECTSLKSITIPHSVTSIGEDAFNYCIGLTGIRIPDSVESIGDWAFYECSSLEVVIIHNSSTSIGEEAFGACSEDLVIYGTTDSDAQTYAEENYITFTSNHTHSYTSSVTQTPTCIEEGEKTYECACGASYTEAIPMAHTLTTYIEYEDEAYHVLVGCTMCGETISETEINAEIIGSGTYGEDIKWYLDNEGTIYFIGSGDMQDYAGNDIPWARYSSDIKKVVIGNGVTNIGEHTFNECFFIESVTIADSVTSIGNEAFYNCSKLTSVSIPDGVTSIGQNAFYNCYKLTSISIPDSVTYIGSCAFSDTGYYNNSSNWENGVLYIDNALIEAYGSVSGVYAIKDGTTVIADYAFNYCEDITNITIPDSVTYIGQNAFYNCSNDLVIDCSCSSYAKSWAAENNIDYSVAHSLTNYVSSNATCTEDGTKTAYCIKCDATDVITEEGTATGHTPAEAVKENEVTATTTEDGSYDSVVYCSECGEEISREKITIPKIKSGKCGDNLTWVLVSDGTLTISGTGEMYNYEYEEDEDEGDSSNQPWFSFSSSIKNVVIESGVTRIGECAFYKCQSLKSVTIADSVTHIGCAAFYGCSSLTSINIPDSVTYIESVAFDNTGYSDNASNWENGVLYIGNALIIANRNISGAYTVKDGTTVIAKYAFLFCESLTSVTIPGSVKNICDDAFYYCSSLTSVTMGDGVTGIGYAAFLDCGKLASITVPNSVTSVGYGAFVRCSKNLVINGYCDSYIKTWAADNGVTFSAMHYFTSYILDNNATCKADGTKTAKCDKCDATDTITEEGTKLAHTPAEAVIENEVAATATVDGSYDSVVYCSECGEEISRENIKTEKLSKEFYEASADKTTLVRGETVTWTVVTSTDVSWLELKGEYTTAAGDTKTLVTYYKASNRTSGSNSVTITDNDGVRTWVITMPLSYTVSDSSITESWNILYKVSGSTEWKYAEVKNEKLVQTITVVKNADVLKPAPSEGYDKYTLVSAAADKTEAAVGETVTYTVVVTSDITKVRIGYDYTVDGVAKTKTGTYQTTSTNVKSIVDNGDGTSTWTITYKVPTTASGVSSFNIQTRGEAWGEAKTVAVNVK